MYIDLYDTSVVGCSNKTDRDSNSEYKKSVNLANAWFTLLIGGETGSRTYTFTEYHKTANDW